MKRGLGLLAVMLMVSALCFANGMAEESRGNAGTNLRFMWWGGDSRHQATMAIIDQFEQDNPGVTIDGEYGGMDGYYQKLTTQVSSGTEPDIIQIIPEWFKPLGKSGKVFINLDDYPELFDISGFNQNYLASACTIDGHVQGVPTGSNGSCLVINRKFMDRFGIPADTVWNWENIEAIGKRIHAQDPECYLIGSYATQITPLSHFLKYYLCQMPGTHGYVNDDLTLGFTEQDVEEALSYFKRLQDEGVMQPLQETSIIKSPVENPEWVNGKIGLMDGMPSTLSTYEAENVELDVAAIPIRDGALDTGSLVGPPQYLVVSVKSPNKEIAVKFLNYFFNDEGAIKTLGTVRGIQPTTKGVEILAANGIISELDEKAMKIVSDNASRSFNLHWLVWDFESPSSDACNAVMLGTLTPAQAAKKMISDFNASCERLKASAT